MDEKEAAHLRKGIELLFELIVSLEVKVAELEKRLAEIKSTNRS